MSANNRQIAGDHYRGEFQHWDLVHLIGMSYMEGQVTRYVARHLKKNGPEDLHKADHYLEKMEERRSIVVEKTLPYFAENHGLGEQELTIMQYLLMGRLGEARAMIASLLTTEYGEPGRSYVDQD